MRHNRALAITACLALALSPTLAAAQSVNVTRSILPEEPYTLIYPEAMLAAGGAGEPLTINHPNAPLQCDLTVVPVEDTGWTAEAALGAFDASAAAASWAETLPGFTLGQTGVVAYQDRQALFYDGTSSDSPMGMPLTLVHTETVSDGRGYALDCLFATEVASQARPIVDFIIANFSTRADADCCVGATVEAVEPTPNP